MAPGEGSGVDAFRDAVHRSRLERPGGQPPGRGCISSAPSASSEKCSVQVRLADPGSPITEGTTPMGHEPYERYEGGSEQAELLVFEELARDLMLAQEKNRRARNAATVDRAFHAKTVMGVANAHLRIRRDLPEDLRR